MRTAGDARIGRAVLTARGDRTQQQVADLMRARGWPWYPQTVGAVERGERPLGLSEATDLADVLGVPLNSLALTGERLAAEVRKAQDLVARARAELSRRERARDRALVDAYGLGAGAPLDR